MGSLPDDAGIIPRMFCTDPGLVTAALVFGILARLTFPRGRARDCSVCGCVRVLPLTLAENDAELLLLRVRVEVVEGCRYDCENDGFRDA